MKKRFTLRFAPNLVNQPLVSKLVRSYDVEINILNGDVSSGKGGMLVVELEGKPDNLKEAEKWLKDIGVVVSPMSKDLIFDSEKCIDCGACTAVCNSGALSLDRDWKLVYDSDKCVVCALCVHACPLKLFTIA